MSGDEGCCWLELEPLLVCEERPVFVVTSGRQAGSVRHVVHGPGRVRLGIGGLSGDGDFCAGTRGVFSLSSIGWSVHLYAQLGWQSSPPRTISRRVDEIVFRAHEVARALVTGTELSKTGLQGKMRVGLRIGRACSERARSLVTDQDIERAHTSYTNAVRVLEETVQKINHSFYDLSVPYRDNRLRAFNTSFLALPSTDNQPVLPPCGYLRMAISPTQDLNDRKAAEQWLPSHVQAGLSRLMVSQLLKSNPLETLPNELRYRVLGEWWNELVTWPVRTCAIYAPDALDVCTKKAAGEHKLKSIEQIRGIFEGPVPGLEGDDCDSLALGVWRMIRLTQGHAALPSILREFTAQYTPVYLTCTLSRGVAAGESLSFAGQARALYDPTAPGATLDNQALHTTVLCVPTSTWKRWLAGSASAAVSSPELPVLLMEGTEYSSARQGTTDPPLEPVDASHPELFRAMSLLHMSWPGANALVHRVPQSLTKGWKGLHYAICATVLEGTSVGHFVFTDPASGRRPCDFASLMIPGAHAQVVRTPSVPTNIDNLLAIICDTEPLPAPLNLRSLPLPTGVEDATGSSVLHVALRECDRTLAGELKDWVVQHGMRLQPLPTEECIPGARVLHWLLHCENPLAEAMQRTLLEVHSGLSSTGKEVAVVEGTKAAAGLVETKQVSYKQIRDVWKPGPPGQLSYCVITPDPLEKVCAELRSSLSDSGEHETPVFLRLVVRPDQSREIEWLVQRPDLFIVGLKSLRVLGRPPRLLRPPRAVYLIDAELETWTLELCGFEGPPLAIRHSESLVEVCQRPADAVAIQRRYCTRWEHAAVMKTLRALTEVPKTETKHHPPRPSGALFALEQTGLGAFATLKDNRTGGLLGCIGRISSPLPLHELLAVVVVDAARHDSRFETPVRLPLPESVSLELTLLVEPAVAIEDARGITLGVHGIRLVHVSSQKSALFLPIVPLENGWTRSRTLVELAKKAGIALPSRPYDWENPAWLKKAELALSRFRCFVYPPTFTGHSS